MAYTFAFTVTQVTYNFTATITTPLSLALTNTPDSVLIYQTTASVRVVNSIQPITVSGFGTSNYNQSLNTFDNVSFNSIGTGNIFGAGGQPVTFPNGINVPNAGTVFINTIDFGPIV
jgi:hypothetical protein